MKRKIYGFFPGRYKRKYVGQGRWLLLLTAWLSLVAAGQASAQIAGRVFRDYNANGIPTSTTALVEPGVAGITVTAFNTAGGSTATTTNANGSYTLTVGAGAYRVEFTGLATGDFSSPVNTATNGSGSSIQLVTVPTASSVNFGINYPTDYCQANPEMVTSCYVFGDQVNGAFNDDPVLVSFPYDAGSRTITANPGFPQSQVNTNGMYDLPTNHDLILPARQLGTLMGIAYSRTTQRVYAAAYFKKHAGFGPGRDGVINTSDDAGAIYITNPNTTSAVSFTTVPNATSNAHGTTNYNIDNGNAAWDAVGKTSLGGMDLSDDDKVLYVMNLQDRRLYALNATTGAVITSASTTGLFPTGCAGCTVANDIRPFAVKFYRGRVYVGLIYSAEASGLATNLRAYIYSADPTTLTFRATPDFVMPLNYPRGKAATTGPANWQPWEPTFTNISTNLIGLNPRLVYAMPMFTGIAFDNGNLIIGLRDRIGDIGGNNTFDQPGNLISLFQPRTAGDILRASGSPATGWTLESNGRSNSTGAAIQNTNQGPGGAEFYQGDSYPASGAPTGSTPYTVNGYSYTIVNGASTVSNGVISTTQGFGVNHDEVSLGTLAQIPGFPEVAAVVFDPVPDNGAEGFHDAGIRWLNNTTGGWARAYRIYNGEGSGTEPTFGKAAGLGGLAAMCDLPTLELGNRVWNDIDKDGIQEPDETNYSGIAGLTINLFQGNTQVGTTAVSATGTYLFTNANVNLNGATGILPNTAYQVRLVLPATKVVTTPGASGTAINSDANASGVISLTTGNAGENNHSYDIGLFDCPTLSNPSAAVSACSGTPVRSLTVTTTATGADAIRFVYFTTVQSGTAMYGVGTSLGTATPASGTAGLSNVAFPANTGATPVTYYVYAIVNPTPGTPGCRPTQQIIVTINPNPVVTMTSATICVGQSATLTATPGFASYSFSAGLTQLGGPGGNTASGAPLLTTTYTVTATSSAGCFGTATGTINVNQLPVPTLTSATICTGQTATLTAGGGTSYTLVNNGTTSSTGSFTANPTATTAYTVIARNGNGCTAVVSSTVIVNPLPTPTLTSATICTGQTATLTAGGGTSYTLVNNGTTSSTGSFTVNPTATTAYTVIARNGNGCTATVSSTVTVNPLPTPTLTSATICTGQTATLTAGGGTSYTLVNDGQVSVTGSFTANPTATTAYTVIARNGNGCTATVSSTVTVNPLPTPTLTSATICTGQTATLTAGGGTSYTLVNNGTTSSTGSFTVNPTATTAYTVIARNGNGCTAVVSSTVTVNPLPTPTLTSATICTGQTATLTAGGGTSYTLVNDGQVSVTGSFTANPTATTAYTVIARNGNGCTATVGSTVTVRQVPVPLATGGFVTCVAAATVTGSSSLTGSTFSWTGPSGFVSTTQTFTTTTPGVYTLTVAANGCSSTSPATATVSLNQTPPQNLSLTSSGLLSCTATTVTLTASSSSTGLTYVFAGPGVVSNNGATATVNQVGSYTVIATSPNGCTASATTIVSQTLLSTTLVQGSCNSNNTNSTTADDYYTISVRANPGVRGPSNRYEVLLGTTVLNPGGTPYGTSVTVGSATTFQANGASVYTLTIRDINTTICQTTRTTVPVASCSSCESVLCPKVTLRKR